MNVKSRLFSFAFLGILCLIIVVAYVVTNYIKPLPIAQAASKQDQAIMNPLSPEAWGYRSCVITDVYTDVNSLLMVVCSIESPVGVDRFAFKGDAANKIFADRALVILNTAYAMNVTISLSYDEFTSANPTGCSTLNCRKLTSVKLFR
jgi:hypothetical protein